MVTSQQYKCMTSYIFDEGKTVESRLCQKRKEKEALKDENAYLKSLLNNQRNTSSRTQHLALIDYKISNDKKRLQQKVREEKKKCEKLDKEIIKKLKREQRMKEKISQIEHDLCKTNFHLVEISMLNKLEDQVNAKDKNIKSAQFKLDNLINSYTRKNRLADQDLSVVFKEIRKLEDKNSIVKEQIKKLDKLKANQSIYMGKRTRLPAIKTISKPLALQWKHRQTMDEKISKWLKDL